jgi:hypothetical protein
MKLSKKNPGVVTIVKNLTLPQSEIASALNALGVVSKTGKKLSASHVSNFLRHDLGLRRVRPYIKPSYKGKNWHSF